MAEGGQPAPLEGYTHSSIHCALLQGDHKALRIILAGLPRPLPSPELLSEEQASAAEASAAVASQVLDRRDVPGKESPLSLAVRLGDAEACRLLCAAGSDTSLQNGSGWTPLQDAVCLKQPQLACIILRYSQLQGWARYQRRLPALAAVMGSMRDFYMELHWAFESPVVPFIARLAPSDTYRIWKRGPNLRADITLAGFDGLRLKRRRQSVLFFGQGAVVDRGAGHRRTFPPGSLLVLHHEKQEAFDALEGAGEAMSDAELAADVAGLMSSGVYKAGVDVRRAWVQPLRNWRGAERTEVVSGYRTTLYEMQDVVFKFRSRKLPREDDPPKGAPEEGSGGADALSPEERQALEEALQGAELDDGGAGRPGAPAQAAGSSRALGRSSSSSNVRSGGQPSEAADPGSSSRVLPEAGSARDGSGASAEGESETRRPLRPLLWVTQDFPLQLSELLPLLDLLASRITAVQRLKDLLTLKLPPGTVPVKVAVPVVPTIRVQATFSKFVEYQGATGGPNASSQSGEGSGVSREPRTGPSLASGKAPLPRSRSRSNGGAALQGQGPELHQEAGAHATSPAALADRSGDGLGRNELGPNWEGLGRESDCRRPGDAQADLVQPMRPGLVAGQGGVAECPSGEEEFHTPPDSPGRAGELPAADLRAAVGTPHLLHSASSPALGSTRGPAEGDTAPVAPTSSSSSPSPSSSSWLSWARGSRSSKGQNGSPGCASQGAGQGALEPATSQGLRASGSGREAGAASEAEEEASLWGEDPFTVPMEYRWITLEVRRRRERDKARKAAKQAQAQSQAQKK